jgi:hypothetical protein
MIWVPIAATISAVIGFISGARGLKALRTGEPASAEITWKQDPLSPWKYETPSILCITLHSLSLVCLTLLILFSVARSPLFTTSFSLTLPFILLSIFALFAILFTPYACGVAVVYHFTQSWISPICYGLREDGIFHGTTFIPWKSFSRYEIGPDEGLISLYSSYSPLLRTWVLRPPSESFARVLATIQRHLPSMPPTEDSIPWQRSLQMMFLYTVLLVFLPLLPAIWGFLRGQSWVWMYAFFAFFFVQYFGIQLFTLFDGREQASLAEDIQSKEPK